ncbi:MAG: hypothetical protein K8F27_02510, partial [Sulfuricellaceae bacterium]|nr:hypothetical protein [Sulfuricellaceae bacterium]
FRRGYLLVLLALVLPQAHPAYAFDWDSLWLRADQRGQQAMAARQPQQAAKLFHDPEWRAAADYRAGNYPAALASLKGIDNAEADYNRGNALARLWRLPEAIAAYQAALKRNPKLDDARYNRDLLEKLQKQAPPQNPSQGPGKQPPRNGQQGPSAGQTPKNGQQSPSTGQPQPSPQASQNSGQSGKPAGEAQQNSGGKTASAANPAAPRGEQPGAGAQQAQAQQAQARPAAPQDGKAQPANGAQAAEDTEEQPKEKRQADEQWLRRIPDDPGGLWRRKFLYQYKQQQQQGSEKQAW